MDTNIDISKRDLDFIRSLEDFDLIMFLSELNQYDVDTALRLLEFIKQAQVSMGVGKCRN